MTQMWLPYAMQEPACFLATLNFAAVHIEAVTGNYKKSSRLRFLRQKGKIIKSIDAKIQDPTEALSNSTIGAVAMLAAAEVRRSSFEILCDAEIISMEKLSASMCNVQCSLLWQM